MADVRPAERLDAEFRRIRSHLRRVSLFARIGLVYGGGHRHLPVDRPDRLALACRLGQSSPMAGRWRRTALELAAAAPGRMAGRASAERDRTRSANRTSATALARRSGQQRRIPDHQVSTGVGRAGAPIIGDCAESSIARRVRRPASDSRARAAPCIDGGGRIQHLCRCDCDRGSVERKNCHAANDVADIGAGVASTAYPGPAGWVVPATRSLSTRRGRARSVSGCASMSMMRRRSCRIESCCTS